LSFIMQNINSDNLFLMTYDEMAKELSISKPTIVETMKALQSSNFLKKVRNGQYAINPDVIFKGNKTNRLNVLIQYQKNEEKEQIEQKKDEQHKED
ncbi:replication/maintenance protein RepL, partial [Escherichia coli]|uniref:replication/maintenance protein RepL n=2 Tax=Bacteria TaxID=2 RepID=UPI003CEB3DE1